MRGFTTSSAILAVLVAILVPPAIALIYAAPQAPPVDPFPGLPPLSELARLPSADIAAHWSRIQHTVMHDAIAKSNDPSVARPLQSRYEDIAFETSRRMTWVNYILCARDPNASECLRRNCIFHLQGFDAYYTGLWPPPVPVEMIPENNP
jgi:hypothetical protein